MPKDARFMHYYKQKNLSLKLPVNWVTTKQRFIEKLLEINLLKKDTYSNLRKRGVRIDIDPAENIIQK